VVDLPLPPGVLAVEADGTDWSSVSHLLGGPITALVVDDVETNRDILAQFLKRIGVDVETADGGPQALAKAEKRLPDVVFMDVRMPGMDGMATRRHLVEAHGRDAMKMIAVSASVLEHEKRQYLRDGFDGFIDKPLRAEKVYASLAQHLDARFAFETRPQEESPEQGGWDGLCLPPEVHQRLSEALRIQSITDLYRRIDDLAERPELGARGRHLAAHLRDLSRQYDLAAIERVLEDVKPTD
jgi:CheY-like chemotaxis protein